MIIRILNAIVVLPLSFLVIGILTLALVDFVGDLVQASNGSITELIHDPQSLMQKELQASWQQVQEQGENLKSLLQVKGTSSQAFLKEKGSLAQGFALVVASIGAIAFFLSTLSDRLNVVLLVIRKYITLPLIFGYSFFLFSYLFYIAAEFVWVCIAKASSVPEDRGKAVADFHAQYDGTLTTGVVIAAGLAALYMAIRLSSWDGLPWCRLPKPAQIPHKSRKSL